MPSQTVTMWLESLELDCKRDAEIFDGYPQGKLDTMTVDDGQWLQFLQDDDLGEYLEEITEEDWTDDDKSKLITAVKAFQGFINGDTLNAWVAALGLSHERDASIFDGYIQGEMSTITVDDGQCLQFLQDDDLAEYMDEITEDDWSDADKIKLVAALKGVKSIVDDRERITEARKAVPVTMPPTARLQALIQPLDKAAASVESAQETINAMRAALAEKDQALAKNAKVIFQKDNVIVQRDNLIVQKENANKALEKVLREKEERIKQLQQLSTSSNVEEGQPGARS